jgi:hypothetical protein
VPLDFATTAAQVKQSRRYSRIGAWRFFAAFDAYASPSSCASDSKPGACHMQQYVSLDSLNTYRGVQLSKEFAKLGIFAWYDSSVPRSACRGGAFFAEYDPINTCFRLFPSSTRYFQASVLANFISPKQAASLSRPLVEFCAQILPSYEGRFAGELKSSVLSRYIGSDRTVAEVSLLEAQVGLFPDVLYAAVPRISSMRHFREGEFSATIVNKSDIVEYAKSPLIALGIAAELISLGPGLNNGWRTINTVFEWVREGAGLAVKRNNSTCQNLYTERVVIPAFSHGLQGITFGFFHNLDKNQRGAIRNQIHQFGQGMADATALLRQKRFVRALEESRNVTEFASSLLAFLSPVEYLISEYGGQFYGYHLNREGEHWVGYSKICQEEINSLLRAEDSEIIRFNIFGNELQVYIKPLKEFSALESSVAWIRANMRIDRLTSKPADRSRRLPLSLSELDAAHVTLNHQIEEGYGAYVACKNLYVVDSIRHHYLIGEATLTNSRCQEFMRKRLGKPDVNGYQVCGRALDKLRLDINKLLPGQIVLEPLANRAVRVLWRKESAGLEALMDESVG